MISFDAENGIHCTYSVFNDDKSVNAPMAIDVILFSYRFLTKKGIVLSQATMFLIDV